MKIKKTGILLLALALVFSLAIAGCGGNAPTTGDNTQNQAPTTEKAADTKSPSMDFNGRTITADDVFKLGEIPNKGIVHTKKSGLKIGLTVSSLEFPVFGTMRDFIKLAAEGDGNEVIFVNGENDIAKQEAAIDNFITEKVDIV
ncbi:MAG: hypothetical protein ACYC21_03590, partial [Eubacteriales bacterium]